MSWQDAMWFLHLYFLSRASRSPREGHLPLPGECLREVGREEWGTPIPHGRANAWHPLPGSPYRNPEFSGKITPEIEGYSIYSGSHSPPPMPPCAEDTPGGIWHFQPGICGQDPMPRPRIRSFCRLLPGENTIAISPHRISLIHPETKNFPEL